MTNNKMKAVTDISEEDVIPGNTLADAGFRTRGHTMFRILHHEEMRYVEIAHGLYAYEGRFPCSHIGQTIVTEVDRDYLDGIQK